MIKKRAIIQQFPLSCRTGSLNNNQKIIFVCQIEDRRDRFTYMRRSSHQMLYSS
jgi:hypothetical protein